MKKYEKELIKRFKNNNKLRRRVNPFRSGIPTTHPLISGENHFNNFFSKLTHQNLDSLLDSIGE